VSIKKNNLLWYYIDMDGIYECLSGSRTTSRKMSMGCCSSS
jgi:hypothetical protein